MLGGLRYCIDCCRCEFVVPEEAIEHAGNGHLDTTSEVTPEHVCGDSAIIRCEECGALMCGAHTFRHPLLTLCLDCGKKEAPRKPPQREECPLQPQISLTVSPTDVVRMAGDEVEIPW